MRRDHGDDGWTLPIRIALVVMLLAVAPLAAVLPVSAGWENGPLENSQAALLFLGAVVAVILAIRARGGPAMWLWLVAVPLWLTLGARELSWGGAFLPPIDRPHAPPWAGPFHSSRMLWYKAAISPALAVVWLGTAWLAWRKGAVRLLLDLVSTHRFAWPEIVLTMIAALLGTVAEGGLGLHLLPGGVNEVVEELAETVGYLGLLAAQARIARVLARADRP